MDFKDRLIIEEKELSEKREKLSKAIYEGGLFDKVDSKQVPFLKIQLHAMGIYLEALKERIKLLDEIKTIEG